MKTLLISLIFLEKCGVLGGFAAPKARVDLLDLKNGSHTRVLASNTGYFSFGTRPCGPYLVTAQHKMRYFWGQSVHHSGDTFVWL